MTSSITSPHSWVCGTLSFTSAQESSGSTEAGIPACYSRRLVGHRTSRGQRYNPNLLTAAHATIPIGTRVKVTNTENGRTVIVLVNDRLSAPCRRWNHHGYLPTRMQMS
jgi:rare lipoprotein A (peptidoglycan hydrolase)